MVLSMTVIAACKVDGRVFIGSDSMVYVGAKKRRNKRKIVKFPGFMVGVAGDYHVVHTLESMVALDDLPKMLHELDAKNFYKRVAAAYKTDTSSSEDDESTSDDSTDSSSDEPDFTLLIATPTKIFDVTSSGALEEETISAIGSGEDLALATMDVLINVDNLTDGMEIVNIAIRVACEHNTYCGIPCYVFEVK